MAIETSQQRDNVVRLPGFRLPNHKQRVTIFGRTGSGKTQFGAWLLSECPFHRQPYIIVDYKGDDLLNACDRIREISLKERPKHPGVYILHPRPDQEEQVEAWLWQIWKRGKTGLYFDEGYVLPHEGKSPALRALLTQGRSKSIPIITLSQRPVWLSRFVFSEADYYAGFHLNDERDRNTVKAFLPATAFDARLEQYHSYWYDVAQDFSALLKPVPDADTILDRFDFRLSSRRTAI